MKLSDVLTEMPYLHQGSMSVPKSFADTFSPHTITRQFTEILKIGDITVFLEKDLRRVVGVNMTAEQPRYQLEFLLAFKEEPTTIAGLNHRNVIQVDQVYLNKYARERTFSFQVYRRLVDLGFTVMSDSTQFEPAKGLWKKLAAESGANYSVTVADIDHGPFKDINGVVIRYDGNNISDSEIWTTGSDFNGSFRVLIFSKV
jgi:hypothetical protein